MARVYDPRGFKTFQDWACLVYESLEDLHIQNPLFHNENNWQEWALGLQGLAPFDSVDIPQPEAYGADWREWAQRIYTQVQDIGEDE